MHRLLRGAALAVDGGPGDVIGQAGGEPAGARDVAGLGADLIDAAEDDVVDMIRIDAGALDERADGVRTEIRGMNAAERPLLLARGGAHRTDNVSLVGHRTSL